MKGEFIREWDEVFKELGFLTNLLDSCWESLARVGSFGSSKTNQLGSTERECSRDEHTAKTFEASIEGT